MDEKYSALFTPWKIGNVEIPNRIVQCSMGGTSLFGWLEPCHFDKEAANFLLTRAKDGVGLVLPGMQCVRDTMGRRWLYQNKKMFKELADYMVEYHKTGSKLFIQLAAGFGRSMAVAPWMVTLNNNKLLGALARPVIDVSYCCASASATPNRWQEDMLSRPMTVEEIHEMVDAFGKTAKLLREAGVDGVEIHAVHEGYLLDQFTIANWNHRTDEYGGSLPNRMRFLRMCLDEVMETAARRNMAVLVKHNMEDGFKGGIEIPESLEIARAIETYGVDGIVLSSGFVSKAPMAVMRGIIPLYTMSYYMQWWLRIFVRLFGRYMIKQYPFEECFFLENAKKFRAELKLPLVYVGGLVSREGIERALDSGFELVQMARALVNDPAFVDKLREGDRSTRSACDHRNYCIARMYSLDMQCCKHCPDLPRKIREELAKLP